ncbi:MAG: TetR/AcrR family transcriptional regulator [Phycisphaerales bacterium]|nr:TetR/AcrR family transcriptional regulator [Phycisphaerales bacterium]
MPSADRRAREKAAVQDRILNAARDLFVREGYEAVSLRKVADAIEYTAPALYTHFKDKADLMRALCRRDFGRLSEALIRVARVEDPVQRIHRIGAAYVRFAVENPHQYRFMFLTPSPAEVEPDQAALAEKDDPERNGYAALRSAIGQAMDRGVFRPEHKDPELLAQVLWAGVHGIASLQITHGQDPWLSWRSLERRTKVMLDGILIGVLSPAAASEFKP